MVTFHFSEVVSCFLVNTRSFTFELTQSLRRLSVHRKLNSGTEKLTVDLALKQVRKLKICIYIE